MGKWDAWICRVAVKCACAAWSMGCMYGAAVKYALAVWKRDGYLTRGRGSACTN